MGNQVKTGLLLGLLTVLIVAVAGYFGGRNGAVIGLVLAFGMNFFGYWFSDKLVLKMYQAQEVTRSEEPQLVGIVEELAGNAGLPVPKVYVIPRNSPNAFATGRNPEHAAVAVTAGLMQLMDREELKGVLAHELAHVKNHDILVGTIAATLAGAVTFAAQMARWGAIFGGGRDDEDRAGGFLGVILMSILAPIAAMLIQMAVSRSREYMADETGAGFAGSPHGLASALAKLGGYSQRLPLDANPATAHMFIVNPLSAGGMANLFSTHPPLSERISRLSGQRPSTPARPGEDIRGPEDMSKASAKDFWNRLS